MKRFKIAEESMLPSLRPGDEIVATSSRRPVVDDMVVFPHPDRQDFWLVKRVVAAPEPVGTGEFWALSDNVEATESDSRTFGPIAVDTALTVVQRLDGTTFDEACRMLAEEDRALRHVVETYGLPDFWQRPPGLPTLVLLILEQQVSLESGAAMYRRLERELGAVTAETIRGIGVDGLRSIGVTRQKAGYLAGLAVEVDSGGLPVDYLEGLPPDDAREALVAVKGIGRWTADAYLLSALRHPDIFPVGDRALQVGTGETVGMRITPDEEALEIISQPWKPVRAAAARLIWHAYLSKRGRIEPADVPTGPNPLPSA